MDEVGGATNAAMVVCEGALAAIRSDEVVRLRVQGCHGLSVWKISVGRAPLLDDVAGR